tara:strand:+ start:3180 stop:4019 length:840 start_codon:yes stop_codon:yes gene_type:complete
MTTTTTTKAKKATVTKTVNKNVKVARFSQVNQDGSIKWNDEAQHMIDKITKIAPRILSNEIDTDKEIQGTQLCYGYLLSELATLEAQTTDKNGKFTKAKRISNNIFNSLIVETFGETWAEKHKNNLTAYRQVYEFTQAEDFNTWTPTKGEGFYDQTNLSAHYNNAPTKFFDTYEIDVINIQDQKTGQFPSLKTLYSKYGFKINKDGQPEKRVPNTSANGANKRKEEKPTSNKQKAEITLQSVKAFLKANDLQASNKMEAITLFGNVIERLAQIEAKNSK